MVELAATLYVGCWAFVAFIIVVSYVVLFLFMIATSDNHRASGEKQAAEIAKGCKCVCHQFGGTNCACGK
jgi:uncharacterized membrane protein